MLEGHQCLGRGPGMFWNSTEASVPGVESGGEWEMRLQVKMGPAHVEPCSHCKDSVQWDAAGEF